MATLISTMTDSTANVNYPCIDVSCPLGFLDLSQPYSFMAQIRRLSSSSAFGNLTHYISIGTDDYATCDEVSSSGDPTRVLSFETESGGAAATGGPYLDDVTYHVAFVRTSNTSWSIYVDGVLQGTGSSAARPSAIAKLIRIGGSIVSGAAANDSINNKIVVDCVRLYNAALTVGEILTESQSRRAVRQSNLVCDLAVCAPGDYLNYSGSAIISLSDEALKRNTSLSVMSYVDLVSGPLTGSPPIEEPVIDFFGDEKLIIINGLSNSNMVVDAEFIYNSWVIWSAGSPENGFPSAFRIISGGPINETLEASSYYFLRNDLGWRIQPKGHSHELTITGNLYPEVEAIDMFVLPGDAFPCEILVKQQLSNLTQVVAAGTESAVYIGDTPPANPFPGDLWWNSSTGMMMVYYNDGNSSQWVVTVPPNGSISYPTAAEIVAEMDANSIMLAQIEANTAATYADTQQVLPIVQDIQTTVNAIETAITSGAFPTLGTIVSGVWNAALSAYTTTGSAGFVVSTILGTIIDNKMRSDEIKTVVDNLLILVDEVLKYDRNRTRIDKVTKTLTVYDDDGITPIRIFNLLDSLGNQNIDEVFERDPGPYAPPAPSTPIIFDDVFGPEFE